MSEDEDAGREHPEGYSERYPKESLGEFLGLDRTSPWHVLASLSVAGVAYFSVMEDDPALRVIGAIGLTLGVVLFLVVLVYQWRND